MPPLRTLIVSDVHANTEGLAAVLQHAEARGGFDALWCCGDIVGYGAEPSGVIAALRANDVWSVAGNHDRAATGQMSVEEFNPVAARAALWTRNAITPQDRAWLDALPLTLEIGDFTLVHGSLREPLWEYLQTPPQAGAQFDRQTTRYSIVGHSHIQFWCAERDGAWPQFHLVDDGDRVALGDTRLILNPGSSGQPRDGDPRAGYMLYDASEHTVTWHRVAYEAIATGEKILRAGLPESLAKRLLIGR
jgi:predicted phosphodiesterase